MLTATGPTGPTTARYAHVIYMSGLTWSLSSIPSGAKITILIFNTSSTTITNFDSVISALTSANLSNSKNAFANCVFVDTSSGAIGSVVGVFVSSNRIACNATYSTESSTWSNLIYITNATTVGDRVFRVC